MKKHLRYLDIGMEHAYDYVVIFNGELLGMCQMARSGREGLVCIAVTEPYWPKGFEYPRTNLITVPYAVLRGNVKIVESKHARQMYPDMRTADLTNLIENRYMTEREKILRSDMSAKEKWDAFERLKVQ